MVALLRSREAECTRIAGQRRGAVTFRLAAEKQRHAALPYYRDCNLEFKRLEDLSEGQHREGHSGRWFCWFAATRLHSLAWGRMREQSVTPSRRARRPKTDGPTKPSITAAFLLFVSVSARTVYILRIIFIMCIVCRYVLWDVPYYLYLYARWMNFNVIVRMQRTCLYGAFTSLGPR